MSFSVSLSNDSGQSSHFVHHHFQIRKQGDAYAVSTPVLRDREFVETTLEDAAAECLRAVLKVSF